MAFSYQYETCANFVRTKATGTVTTNDLIKYVRNIIEDTNIKGGFVEIVDFTSVEDLVVTYSELSPIPLLWEKYKEKGCKATIIFAPTDFSFGTFRMLQTVVLMVKKMHYKSINLRDKLAKFSDHWSPKIIAQMNDYHFKLVKFQGDFVWHRHDDTDEVFIVLEGEMTIEFKADKVDLKAGEMFVVPKGAEHKPFADQECKVMLVEPAGTVNTGDAGGDLTAEGEVWI